MRAVRPHRIISACPSRPQRCLSTAALSLDERVGFRRPMIEPLKHVLYGLCLLVTQRDIISISVNTIEPYGRHVFICTNVKAPDWAAKPALGDPFFMSFLNNLKSAGATGPTAVRVNLSEEDEPTSPTPARDLLVFPDMVKLRAVTEAHLPSLCAQLVSCAPQWPTAATHLTGQWYFVCAHAKTDERCGLCGPLLAETLRELAGGDSDVHIRRCSHVGGHKYAGNVITLPQGDWYGYVTPTNLPDLFAAVQRGECYESLLRGKMHPKV